MSQRIGSQCFFSSSGDGSLALDHLNKAEHLLRISKVSNSLILIIYLSYSKHSHLLLCVFREPNRQTTGNYSRERQWSQSNCSKTNTKKMKNQYALELQSLQNNIHSTKKETHTQHSITKYLLREELWLQINSQGWIFHANLPGPQSKTFLSPEF